MKVIEKCKEPSLCEKCTGLCCRYFSFEIDKPETRRDFDDIRWYVLHMDTTVFVEDGDWYIQINRKCKALMPDNRCAVYEKRPAICRVYKTGSCDWQSGNYDYEHVFSEPDQIERYAREFLAKKRKKRLQARKRAEARAQARRRQRAGERKASRIGRPGPPVRLLKSA
jgi:uncharacterized protein